MSISLRRFQLRERTAAAHAVLDSAIGGFDTLDTYRRYVLSLYRFRAPLEAMLDADWSDILGGWRPASLVPDIRADLTDLGVPIPARLPQTARIPADNLLGTLYVLEGSALGARVLFERAQALGLSGEFGARHLARQCGRLQDWRIFLDILEATPAFDIETAASASLAAFAVANDAFGAH